MLQRTAFLRFLVGSVLLCEILLLTPILGYPLVEPFLFDLKRVSAMQVDELARPKKKRLLQVPVLFWCVVLLVVAVVPSLVLVEHREHS